MHHRLQYTAEATIDGAKWRAVDLAVAGGHERLAACINAYLDSQGERPAAPHPTKRQRLDPPWRPSSAGSSHNPVPSPTTHQFHVGGTYIDSRGHMISITRMTGDLETHITTSAVPAFTNGDDDDGDDADDDDDDVIHGRVNISNAPDVPHTIRMFQTTATWYEEMKAFAWPDGDTWSRRPHRPPGPGWTRYFDDRYPWWYYSGHLGEWYIDGLVGHVVPYPSSVS